MRTDTRHQAPGTRWMSRLTGVDGRWWKGLTNRERLYVVYFVASFVLLACAAEEMQLWMPVLMVANFANAARLVKRVPTEGLDE